MPVFAERKGLLGLGAGGCYYRALANLGKVTNSTWALSVNILVNLKGIDPRLAVSLYVNVHN